MTSPYYFRKKSELRRSGFAIAVAVAWLLFVTFLLCTPGSRLPKLDWQDKIWLDKWAHIFLFFVLVVLWCRVYRLKKTGQGIRKLFISITMISIMYGIFMEIIQHYFVPFRSFDYGDMIADGIGAVGGYFISRSRFKPMSAG